ncbi:MAG TPA: ADP-ribosylglycohydrolase family protein [Thermomicrobiales bacterium]|nr:ADP-ribosylglycohydrolase family protein [Thermomicrobiales bacterium]
MRMAMLDDRYRGCLLGLGCGDALGGPVEFMERDAIAAAYPGGLRDFVGGGWLDLAPGEITDDTQLTLALARALNECGLDMDAFAADLIAWLRSQPKDIGNTTRASLEALAEGSPWQRAGEDALARLPTTTTASNGAVMRCAPVALRYRRDPAALVEASLDSARITHAEPRAAWATVAVNQAIVHLLDGGDPADAPAAAARDIPNDEVRTAVRGAAAKPRASLRASGFALHTLEAAFWSLLNAADAEAAIIAAVALGEDADTTGAVAGALAGAWQGASALPERWLARLQPRAELTAHADRLLVAAGG